MESGLFYGYVGLIEGLVERIRGELGATAVCVATGGLADVISPRERVHFSIAPRRGG